MPTLLAPKKILILPGIAHFGGEYNPKGFLDRPPAIEWSRRMGYEPIVLDISGEASYDSRQTNAALEMLVADPDIVAIYGFSGGGYNARHILNRADFYTRARIELVVILGAPRNSPDAYKGPWRLIYRKDPPQGHMYGPQALLNELK